MKKILKRLSRLIDFLIKVLTKCVKVGVKVIDEYEAAGTKVEKIANVLVEVGEIIEKLQGKKQEIEQLANEE